MELKKIQKDIWQNKVNKGFNTTDVNKEFCLLYGEVAEAYDAWRKKKDDLNEELADIAIYLMGLSEMLGFDLEEDKESILVNYRKKSKLKKERVELSAHNDHRIAMMIGIASTVYEGEIILDDASCVKKSYPDFWKVFSSLGGKFYECMGK